MTDVEKLRSAIIDATGLILFGGCDNKVPLNRIICEWITSRSREETKRHRNFAARYDLDSVLVTPPEQLFSEAPRVASFLGDGVTSAEKLCFWMEGSRSPSALVDPSKPQRQFRFVDGRMKQVSNFVAEDLAPGLAYARRVFEMTLLMRFEIPIIIPIKSDPEVQAAA